MPMETIGRSHSVSDAIGRNCGMWINIEESIGSKSLEGLSTLGRLDLEGLFDICVFQLIH